MLAVAALVLSACGDSNDSRSAELDVRYSNADTDVSADYTITCGDTATLDGDEVDVDADAACEALDDTAVTDRLVDPSDDRACTEIYGGADLAEIDGTIDDSRVETTVDRADGCGISDWDDVLGALLPPPVGVTDPSSPTTTAATTTTVTDPSSSTAPTATTEPTGTTAPPPPTTEPTNTTTTSSAVPSTTAAPTTTMPAPERLDAWPAPPEPTSLDDIPFLLPSGPIEGVASAIREQTELAPGDSAAATGDYLQVWLTDDGSSQVTIRTHLDGEPSGSEEFRVPVDVAPWESAFTFEDTGPFNGVTLVGDGGFVAVESYGLDEDAVIDLARSITRRSGDEPGWAIDAPDLVAVHEGWAMPAVGTASREIDWYDGNLQLQAELSISAGQPARFAQIWQPDSDVTIDEVRGSQAMVVQYDYGDAQAPTIVIWSTTDDQVIQFGVLADVERALEIARSIGPVSQDVWNSVAEPPAAPRDGCNTFVC